LSYLGIFTTLNAYQFLPLDDHKEEACRSSCIFTYVEGDGVTNKWEYYVSWLVLLRNHLVGPVHSYYPENLE